MKFLTAPKKSQEIVAPKKDLSKLDCNALGNHLRGFMTVNFSNQALGRMRWLEVNRWSHTPSFFTATKEREERKEYYNEFITKGCGQEEVRKLDCNALGNRLRGFVGLNLSNQYLSGMNWSEIHRWSLPEEMVNCTEEVKEYYDEFMAKGCGK